MSKSDTRISNREHLTESKLPDMVSFIRCFSGNFPGEKTLVSRQHWQCQSYLGSEKKEDKSQERSSSNPS